MVNGKPAAAKRFSESISKEDLAELGALKPHAEGLKSPQKQVPAGPAAANATLKWAVLAFLVVQNSGASLLMRYSRSQPGEGQWNTQTGVIMQEVTKAAVCIILLARQGILGTVFADKREALKTGIPAIIYLLQNNLQYVAVSYLEASTYAVLYQLKILATALLSVVLLRKQLLCIQWLALVLLTIGVAMVVVSQMAFPSGSPAAGGTGEAQQRSIVPGLLAVLLACLFSGLAGVSFEKLLKGSQVSLWTRNLQMALYSIVIGVGNLYWEQRTFSIGTDFFHGYTTAAWLAILNNALGGLLIAAVIKYADNIMKNFSTSLSIVLTAGISVEMFGSLVNTMFCSGTCLVLYAVPLYGGVSPHALLRILSRAAGPAVEPERQGKH